MAWLTNWIRRKQLDINGTTAGIQSSYQMMITVYYGSSTDNAGNIYCGGNCKADFSDIRFTDSTGSTLLNYWVASITGISPNQSASIWVQIPSIPTGTNSTYIYLYYNNPSATSSSNAINTFIFFDNFPNINNWLSSVSGGGSVSYDSTNGRMKVNLYKCGYSHAYHDLGTLNQGISVDFDWWTHADSWYELPSWRVLVNGTNASGFPLGFPISSGGNYSSHNTQTANVNGSIRLEYDVDQSIYCANGDHGNTYIEINNVRIRNYASPEPTWSSTISSEQSVTLIISSAPVTGAEIWLRTPAGSGPYIDQRVSTTSTLYTAPGIYDVKLTLGGYQDYVLANQTFSTGEIYNIQATLIPIPGSLSISSTPTGAEIYLGLGTPIDQGITTVPSGTTISNLSPGTYNIRLTLTGYQDWTGTATVTPGCTSCSLSATFAGSTYITSTPSGAEIYLAVYPGSPIDQSVATTSIITNMTAASSGATTTWNYKLTLSGYVDTSGLFIATAGSIVNVSVTFPGSLYITSIPTGASIYIDNVLQ